MQKLAFPVTLKC